jgi:hypothetical protein
METTPVILDQIIADKRPVRPIKRHPHEDIEDLTNELHALISKVVVNDNCIHPCFNTPGAVKVIERIAKIAEDLEFASKRFATEPWWIDASKRSVTPIETFLADCEVTLAIIDFCIGRNINVGSQLKKVEALMTKVKFAKEVLAEDKDELDAIDAEVNKSIASQ